MKASEAVRGCGEAAAFAQVTEEVWEGDGRDILAWLTGRHAGQPSWPPMIAWRGIP